jgi:hypothetical protein
LNPIRGSNTRLRKACNEVLAKNFLDDRIKKAELGGAYGARKREGKCIEGWVGKQRTLLLGLLGGKCWEGNKIVSKQVAGWNVNWVYPAQDMGDLCGLVNRKINRPVL